MSDGRLESFISISNLKAISSVKTQACSNFVVVVDPVSSSSSSSSSSPAKKKRRKGGELRTDMQRKGRRPA